MCAWVCLRGGWGGGQVISADSVCVSSPEVFHAQHAVAHGEQREMCVTFFSMVSGPVPRSPLDCFSGCRSHTFDLRGTAVDATAPLGLSLDLVTLTIQHTEGQAVEQGVPVGGRALTLDNHHIESREHLLSMLHALQERKQPSVTLVFACETVLTRPPIICSELEEGQMASPIASPMTGTTTFDTKY